MVEMLLRGAFGVGIAVAILVALFRCVNHLTKDKDEESIE
jgi:hypothetical protein